MDSAKIVLVWSLVLGGILSAGCGSPSVPIEADSDPQPVGALQWHDDWDAALDEAKDQQKPLLVYFSADWCIWCKRLESDTFSDPNVAALLDSSFVLVRQIIDADGRERATQMKVSAPPTIVVLNADGSEIGRILGYVPAQEFRSQLVKTLGRDRP